MSTFLALSIPVFFILSFLLRKYLMSRKQRLHPPGPKPKPFIGNALDIPTEDVANAYIEWGRKYNSQQIKNPFYSFANIWPIGSIIHASALGTHIVVLNKLEDAVELLEKRATIYSDRPQVPIRKL